MLAAKACRLLHVCLLSRSDLFEFLVTKVLKVIRRKKSLVRSVWFVFPNTACNTHYSSTEVVPVLKHYCRLYRYLFLQGVLRAQYTNCTG